MSILSVKNLWKEFHVARRKKGLIGSFSSLISRQYDVKTALCRISFDINEGELVGYIGPNGAGKSTTVKILSGILVPDGGRVTVGEKIPGVDRIEHVRRIGVVFGQRTQLWWDLPVMESFDLLREIYDVPRDKY